jgi:hypothetical protein
VPLLSMAQPTRAFGLAASAALPLTTKEREAAILVADLRRLPSASPAHRSAHDAVYTLNLFCEAVGDAVAASSGMSCGFVAAHAPLALFGLHDADLGAASRQALAAAERIEAVVRVLQARLVAELGVHTELTLVLHAGAVVVGSIGPRDAKGLSALGDAMEAARRLYDVARNGRLGFVASAVLLQAAGVAPVPSAWGSVEIEGDGKQGHALHFCGGASSSQCLVPAVAPSMPA